MTPWETVTDPQCPKEGELFKEIHAYGKVFEIRYGYYEERDRYTRYPEPIPLYPDFLPICAQFFLLAQNAPQVETRKCPSLFCNLLPQLPYP